jgi:hypothetical protein
VSALPASAGWWRRERHSGSGVASSSVASSVPLAQLGTISPCTPTGAEIRNDGDVGINDCNL